MTALKDGFVLYISPLATSLCKLYAEKIIHHNTYQLEMHVHQMFDGQKNRSCKAHLCFGTQRISDEELRLEQSNIRYTGSVRPNFRQ